MSSYPNVSPQVHPRCNSYAIASFVVSIVVFAIGSPVALFLGYKAKREIARNPDRETGAGFATAGIILGWFGLVFLVLFAVYFGWMFVQFSSMEAEFTESVKTLGKS